MVQDKMRSVVSTDVEVGRKQVYVRKISRSDQMPGNMI